MPRQRKARLDRRVAIIDDPGGDRNRVQRVSDLRSLPFVVLLGEPGMGKSTVLEGEAALEGVPLLTVRELMTGLEAHSATTVFLDALDEYRIDGSRQDKVHGLAKAITALQPPRWRLSCRSEDWRKEADIAPIQKTTGGAAITVAQLLPLNRTEAAAVLAALGEPHPEGFIEKAISLGAAGFIESPLSLKLLRSAVARGQWPSTRFELFDLAVEQLLFESNSERRSTERRAPRDIRGAAAKACLLLLTSGTGTIWRSNAAPPTRGDTRANLTAHDLGLERDLLD